VALLRDTNYRGFKEYFSGFGFGEAFRTEADNEKYPPPALLPVEELTVERMRRVKYALAGTPPQVRAEIEALQTLYGSGGELEWFGWFFDQGFMPWDETQRQFESFAKEIIPHFR
jgi:alkanesulfonate monooxygenase SsuD/methylene tetrahydromethanopterin reductase-like flavin-dependent oxidoreductase (luciferase family)